MAPKPPLEKQLSLAKTYSALDLFRHITIDKPTEGSELCSPMDVQVTWFPAIAAGTFKAMLDNVDVTNLFNASLQTAKIASASLPVTEYNGSLTVSAEFPSYWNPGTFIKMEDVRTFHVPGTPTPRLNATLIPYPPGISGHDKTAIDIVKGMQSVFKVTLIPEGRCHPAVEIRAFVAASNNNVFSGPYIPGITMNTPFVIPAGTDSGLLYITAANTVPVGTYYGVLGATAAASPAFSTYIEWVQVNVQPPV